MADNSAIEQMLRRLIAARKTAAARIGVTLAEYDRRRAAGEKWCSGCKSWHPNTEFADDQSRSDGRAKACRAFVNEQSRQRYVPKSRPAPGRRYVAARPDDREQARRRVNHLVDVGILPDPNDMPCVDCGHMHVEGERRHEYDHHLGYGPENHEDVQALCTTCHHRREAVRRAVAS